MHHDFSNASIKIGENKQQLTGGRGWFIFPEDLLDETGLPRNMQEGLVCARYKKVEDKS